MTGTPIVYSGNDVAINGIVLNRIDPEGMCIWVVEDIDGWWGLPEATAPDSPRSVYEDGATAVAGRYLSRKLTLSGYIIPMESNLAGQAFTVAARNAFNRALNLIRTQGILQVNGDPAQMANVQVIDRPLTQMSKANDVLKFEISLRASDPRKYEITEQSLSTNAYTGTVGRAYNKVYDYNYGAEQQDGLLNAYNEGTYNTFGKIVIHGPSINPSIEHINSNSRLSFNITLAAGEYLEIDLAVHTVYLNGTANRRSSLLPSSTWFALEPGDNFLRFSATQSPPPTSGTKDRINLIANPNATSGSPLGWVSRTSNESISVTAHPSAPANNVYKLSTASDFQNPQLGFETASTARPRVTPFSIYAFSVDVRNQFGNDSTYLDLKVTANIAYYDSLDTLLSIHEGTIYRASNTQWTRVAAVAQAPSGAFKASVFVRFPQYGVAQTTTLTGWFFDNVMLEEVITAGTPFENIARNGNLTTGISGWGFSSPGRTFQSNNRTYSTYGEGDDIPANEVGGRYIDATSQGTKYSLYDYKAEAPATENRYSNRYGLTYSATSGFTIGETYAFSTDVKSTINQTWAVKVKALTFGGTTILGPSGSQYIAVGTSKYIAANEWSRISATAVVPSGTATLRAYFEPADGYIYGVNTVANPSFEKMAVDETAFSAITYNGVLTSEATTRISHNNARTPNGQFSISPEVFPWAAGSYGTSGIGSTVTVATGGYNNGYATKKTWTTAPTSPATQADLGILYNLQPVFNFEPYFSVRAWLTASKTSNHQIAIEFINGSSVTVSTWVGPVVSVGTAGALLVADGIPNPYPGLSYASIRIHLGPYAAGFTPAIGDYITASALVIEYAKTSTPYYDPATPQTWDKAYGGDPLYDTAWIDKTTRAVYRSNLATNPRPNLYTTNWNYQNGTSGTTALSIVTNELGPTDQFGFRRATVTAADTGGNSGHFYRQDGAFAGQIGDTHVLSMWVRSSVAQSVNLSCSYRASGASVGTNTVVGPVALEAGRWTRLSATSTATTTYDGIQIWAVESASGPATGSTIDATGVMIEASSKYILATNLVADPSFESVSPAITGVNATAAQSSVWADTGVSSISITPTGASNDTYAIIAPNLGANIMNDIASKARIGGSADNFYYTFSGTLYRPTAATGSLGANITKLVIRYTKATTGATVFTDSLSTTSAVPSGIKPFSGTIQLPASLTSLEVRLYNGTSVGNGVLYFDSFSVVPETQFVPYSVSPYFSGSTAASGTTQFAWTGAANGSISQKYISVTPTLQPYFDGDSVSQKELSRNYIQYPQPAAATTGWGVTAGTTGVANIAWSGNAGVAQNGTVRATWTTANTVADGFVAAGSNATATMLTPGAVYSGGIYVRPSVSMYMTAHLSWRDTSAAAISTSTSGPSTYCPEGVWTRVMVENMTAPAGTYGVQVRAQPSAVMAVNQYIDADQAMVSPGTTLPTYFDGSTKTANGSTEGRWLGTAFASPSLLQGKSDLENWWNTNKPQLEASVQTLSQSNYPTIAGNALLTATSSEYQEVTSQNSLRLVPMSDSNDTYVRIDWTTPPVPTDPVTSKNYTVFATIVIDKVQTGSLSASARRFAWLTSSSVPIAVSNAVPNVVGRYKIKWSQKFGSTAVPSILRFYNGASKGNGDVWIEKLSIVPISPYQYDDAYYAEDMGIEFYQIPEVQGLTNIPNTTVLRTGVTELYRNSVENPAMRYLGSQEPNVVRNNLMVDPRGTALVSGSTDGWLVMTDSDNLTTSTPMKADGPEGRQEFIRSVVKSTLNPHFINDLTVRYLNRLATIELVPGQAYTYSVWVRTAEASKFKLEISSNDTRPAVYTLYKSTSEDILPNVWTRIRATFIAPSVQYAPLTSLAIYGSFEGTQNTVTQVWDFGSALLEKTEELLPYFDGSMSSGPDYTYRWVGDINTSASTKLQTGVKVLRKNLHKSPTTIGSISGAPTSAQWRLVSPGSGTAALGFKANIADAVYTYSVAPTTGGSVATVATTSVAATGIPVEPFVEYAFSADTIATKTLATGTRAEVQWLDKNNVSISTSLGSYSPYLTANTYARRSLLSVAPSGARFAVPRLSFSGVETTFVVGDALGGTNALFEKTNYVDSFFSGSTSPSGSANLTSWDGPSNNSSSSMVDSRALVTRTNYAKEPIPLSTTSTHWFYTPVAGETDVKILDNTVGTNNVLGVYKILVQSDPVSAAPRSILGYTEKVAGKIGDVFTGSLWVRFITQSGTRTEDVNVILTYKRNGVTVNTNTVTRTLPYNTWMQLFSDPLTSTGIFDEIIVSVATGAVYTEGSVLDMYMTQALIEKTPLQSPWFDSTHPVQEYDRVNYFSNPSFEQYDDFLTATITNWAKNSGPWGALSYNGSTWSIIPNQGAVVSNQLISNADDIYPYASPHYVRTVYGTAATVTGNKGIQYVDRIVFGEEYGLAYIDMYVRSSVAISARIVATVETVSGTVVNSSPAVSATNLVPNQWTRLRNTVSYDGSFVHHNKVMVVLGDASTPVPAGTVIDASSVQIYRANSPLYIEYNDKLLPSTYGRTYGGTYYIHNYVTTGQSNLVLDPTLQYGADDWKITPGWGTGGTGTGNVELNASNDGGYGLVRRWTATPSNSTSVSAVGSGYLLRSAVAGRRYSFFATYAASKDSTVDAWVTWYTDATLSTVVSRTLLSSTAYTASSGYVTIKGDNALAPSPAGFGLFTVGTYSVGFNPQNGDWTAVSKMRIDLGRRIFGQYFDVSTLTGTDVRYQINGQPGKAATYEMNHQADAIFSANAACVLDGRWALYGNQSLRITPTNSTVDNSAAVLLNSNTEFLSLNTGKTQTWTISATIRIGPEGHFATAGYARRIMVESQDHWGNQITATSDQASGTPNNIERLNVKITIPSFASISQIYLYNGGFAGDGDVWWDGVLIEKEYTPEAPLDEDGYPILPEWGYEGLNWGLGTPGEYFDGSTPAPPGKKIVWAGPPNASVSLMSDRVPDFTSTTSVDGSVLIAYKPYTVEPSNGSAVTQSIRGPVESPSAYARVANYGTASNNTYATVGAVPGAIGLNMAAGGSYTAMGTVMVEEAQHGSLHPYARSLAVLYTTAASPSAYQAFVSSAAPNATGSYELRLKFTLPSDTTEAFLALYNGSDSSDDRVYWTNVGLMDANYSGPYFDGSTAEVVPGEKPAWIGAIDASASVVTGGYPANVYPTNSRVVSSTFWSASGSGTRSVKVVPTGTEDSYIIVRDSAAATVGSAPSLPLTNTTPRQIRGTIHLEAAQVGTLSPYARGIAYVDSTTEAITLIAQAPNTSGTYDLVGTIPGTVNVKEIRLYNGSNSVSGAPVWWDHFSAIYVPTATAASGVAAYTGPYFDGSTASTDTVAYTWTDDSRQEWSQASEPHAGSLWPSYSTYYADKVAINTGGRVDFFDGRTPPTTTEVYYYTGADEASSTYAVNTSKPAINTYFDGNTASAFWNGFANNSSSTLPGTLEIRETMMNITYRSAWIE